MAPAIEDIDLNFGDFQQRVNADLVGKLVNIASRCAGFIHKDFDGCLSAEFDETNLLEKFRAAAPTIAQAYEDRDFAKAMREVMALADLANQYIDRRKPWTLARDPAASADVQRVCSTGIALFRTLIIYLKPVLPKMAHEVEEFLNCGLLQWHDIENDLHAHQINAFKPLMQRVETEKIEAMIRDSKPSDVQAPLAAPTPEADDSMITIDDFAKLDLRIARVLKAQAVEGADKLLQLTLEVGDSTRNVFAGIKSAYEPATLEGRFVVVLANLRPRKMRFGVSEGMVLAAGPGGDDIFLISPDTGAESGMQVK
jgi:methionyl-tRNA synthetase